MTMEINCIRDINEFHNMKEEWNDLIQNSDCDTIFYRHEWLSSWWQSYGGQRELLILTVRKTDKLIGLAPLMISKEKVRGIPVHKIAFMGDATWTIGDFIIKDRKEEVLEKILEYLLGLKWDITDLQNIPADSYNSALIPETLLKKRLAFVSNKGISSPVADVKTSWDDFYQSRSLRFRKATRNKLNKINKAGEISINKYSSKEEIQKVLPVIFEIGMKGWKHRQLKNAISSTDKNKSFYISLSDKISHLGCLNIWLLSLNDKPIAFEYHIQYKGVNHGLIADFDEGYKELSPGSILDFHIMQHIFQDNTVDKYDLGSGESFYKTNWTDKVNKCISLSIYRDTFRGSFLKFAETKVIPGLKRLRDKLNKSGKKQ